VKRPVLKIAVVGHTNTGKTSLLRTLIRDAGFGEVSNRPSTTRHVEGTSLLVGGEPMVELYDTPGLEDSIGLLEHLDTLRGNSQTDRIEIIHQFLDSPLAQGEFEQEAKTIRQILHSNAALYVVDTRDRVLGKHRDELEILGHCARPVVPVLNFVVSPEAKTTQWRDHLARVNMHATAEFDTVVLDEYGELRLFQKMQTLLDPFRPTLEALIEDRKNQRARLIKASAGLLADLLLDVAAYSVKVPTDTALANPAMVSLKQTVCEREQQCVDSLLELFRFQPNDYASETLPIQDGQWGLDLFSPSSLKQFGIRASGGAAAGGLAGLSVDAMVGGATLGAGAVIGAAVGALWSSSKTHGRRIADRMRGFTELRVNDTTLRLLAVRQIDLVQALLRRGHASQEKIRLETQAASKKKAWTSDKLPKVLARAKVNSNWSRLDTTVSTVANADVRRLAARNELAQVFEAGFVDSES